MCILLSSSNKCEIVGHWPTVFSDHHDEDGFNQAHRVYGVSEKVRKQGKFFQQWQKCGMGLWSEKQWMNYQNEFRKMCASCSSDDSLLFHFANKLYNSAIIPGALLTLLEKYLYHCFNVLICIRGPEPISASLQPNLLTLKRPADPFWGPAWGERKRHQTTDEEQPVVIKMHEMQLPYKHLLFTLVFNSFFFFFFLRSSTFSFIKPIMKIISQLHSDPCTPHHFFSL